MKSIDSHARLMSATLLIITSLGLTLTSHAQRYAIESSTTDSGGGSSKGGRFTVHGTIGQADAGTSSGGRYRVDGGFWGGNVRVVQTTGLPELMITKSGKNGVIVSWVDNDSDVVLQESRDLKAGGWAASARAIRSNGAIRSLVISNATGSVFFRLSRN